MFTTSMNRIDLVTKGGFKAGENLVTSKVERPTPSKGQVIIDIAASAINPVDWKMAEYGFLIPQTGPAALGCDVAGTVSAADESDPVAKALLGKRVVAYLGAIKMEHATDRGAYGDAVAMEAEMVFEIPDSVSFSQAASVPVGAMTAVLLLEDFAQPEDPSKVSVVVWGASSSVGYNCVQIASKRGYQVIGVASAKHTDKILEAGAKYVVDYRTEKDVAAKIASLDTLPIWGACDCVADGSEGGSYLTLAKILSEQGTAPEPRIVTSVGPGMPQGPANTKCASVDFGTSLTNPPHREYMKNEMPDILSSITYQPIRAVKGPVSAETVEEAFQVQKNGVSGEKVVIEWEK